MLCPNDGTELRIIERQGVQIDLCPRCEGVWLDRGELDKIIDGAYALPATAPGGQDPPAVGVWADSIQPTPIPAPPKPQQQLQLQQDDPPQPSQAGQPDMGPITIPTLGGLLAGLASGQVTSQGQRRSGRRRPRGWLEEMFNIDLD